MSIFENEAKHALEELTDEQAHTLCELILYGKKHGWRLMHPRDLAQKLQITKAAAQKRVSRLVNKHPDCFVFGRDKILNEPNLCTEKRSAVFFLTIAELANNDKEGTIHEDNVRKCLLQMDTINNNEEADKFIKVSISAGYLERLVIMPRFFRMANKYHCHKKLIKMLSNDCQP